MTSGRKSPVSGRLTCTWGLNRPEQARGVLDQAAGHVAVSAQRAGLEAMRARFLLHAGHCPKVLNVLGPVLADSGVPHRVLLEAMATATMALVACGRYDDAIAVADRGLRWPGRQQVRAGCWRWMSWPRPRPLPIYGAGNSPRRPAWPNPATSEPWRSGLPPTSRCGHWSAVSWPRPGAR